MTIVIQMQKDMNNWALWQLYRYGISQQVQEPKNKKQENKKCSMVVAIRVPVKAATIIFLGLLPPKRQALSSKSRCREKSALGIPTVTKINSGDIGESNICVRVMKMCGVSKYVLFVFVLLASGLIHNRILQFFLFFYLISK